MPFKVKMLVAIYGYSLMSQIFVFFVMFTQEKMSVMPFVAFVVSISFLVAIFRRVKWVWKAGLVDAAYLLGTAIYLYVNKGEYLAKVNESVNKETAYDKIDPKFIENVSAIGLYGGMALTLTVATMIAILWYKSRGYFESDLPEE